MTERPYAKVIADSFSPTGVRLTSMEVCFHRFVLAEFNTHRLFSRNSASSRAIPVNRQIDRIVKDLASPLSWPQEQRGMQGGDELSPETAALMQAQWRAAAGNAIRRVRVMQRYEVHKSVLNRLLEPFMWHTVLVTATAWDNFFVQRCSPLAQPELRAAAMLMRDAYDQSTPVDLKIGQWHMPYIRPEDYADANERTGEDESPLAMLTRVSAARCARTSYLTQDGTRDMGEDIRLYARLVERGADSADPRHWSPLEHVATPWPENHGPDELLHWTDAEGWSRSINLLNRPLVGNLLHWRSLRTEMEAVLDVNTYC